MTDLTELKAAALAATLGAREVFYNPDDNHDGRPSPSWWVRFGEDEDSSLLNEADARYIALANPQAVFALLTLLEAAAAVVEAVKEVNMIGHHPRRKRSLGVLETVAAYDALGVTK